MSIDQSMRIKFTIFVMAIISLSIVSGSYAASPNELTQIKVASTEIFQDAFYYSVKVGQSVQVKGKMKKINGYSYLPYRYLDFCIYDNNGTQLVHQKAITDVFDAWARVTINPVQWNLSPGHYQLKIKYSGNTKTLPIPSTNRNRFCTI
jgi:hypothetical protein